MHRNIIKLIKKCIAYFSAIFENCADEMLIKLQQTEKTIPVLIYYILQGHKDIIFDTHLIRAMHLLNNNNSKINANLRPFETK